MDMIKSCTLIFNNKCFIINFNYICEESTQVSKLKAFYMVGLMWTKQANIPMPLIGWHKSFQPHHSPVSRLRRWSLSIKKASEEPAQGSAENRTHIRPTISARSADIVITK